MKVSHGLCLIVSVIGTACGESAETMNANPGSDREVTVEAALDVMRPTLTVATYGDGRGSVATAPAAASCSGSCAVTVENGARVALTAVPEDGSEFVGWSGPDCEKAQCTVTVTADQRVTAVFGRHRSLVVIKAGSGDGTVASSPPGISCGNDCSQVYRTGTVVALTATPAAGSRFVGWRGGGCSGDGTCVVPLEAATLVEARFSRMCRLTVGHLGEGDGRVTSDPRGISCGRDCTEVFACGTRVQLTAVPVRSTFGGWSGACSGTGPCTVTLVDASTRVDAAFTVCGNGVVEPGEQCDDGNQRDGDGCDSTCRLPRCGNGVLDPGEQCDDGNQIGGDGCSPACRLEVCGNGVLDPGEQCDAGGQSAFCDSDCTVPVCGDGLVNPAAGEQCDDGNAVSGDGCSAQCQLEVCGNGVLDPGEQCDDGNQIGGDGCSAQCQLEVCGNGILDPGEQCDFGGETAFCDSDCTVPVCGDGLVNPAAGEQCDDGNAVSGDGCSAQCQLEVCGNGIVDPGEQCDFGGETAFCDSDCTFPVCGDALVNLAAGEQCDDGAFNGMPGDRCSATCTLQ
jgi:cysteine-rich repeat protein